MPKFVPFQRVMRSSAVRKVGALVTLAAVSGMASAQSTGATLLDFSGATSEVTTAIGGLVADNADSVLEILTGGVIPLHGARCHKVEENAVERSNNHG